MSVVMIEIFLVVWTTIAQRGIIHLRRVMVVVVVMRMMVIDIGYRRGPRTDHRGSLHRSHRRPSGRSL
jgi:hypothetical protein